MLAQCVEARGMPVGATNEIQVIGSGGTEDSADFHHESELAGCMVLPLQARDGDEVDDLQSRVRLVFARQPSTGRGVDRETHMTRPPHFVTIAGRHSVGIRNTSKKPLEGYISIQELSSRMSTAVR